MADLPTVSIEYCVVWNYYPKASGLAAAIDKEFGVTPQLVKGSGGVFEVTVNSELIYSKRATGRFPEHDEIFYHVKAAMP